MTTYKRAVCPYYKAIDDKEFAANEKQECYNCDKIYKVIKIGKNMYRSYKLEELDGN